MLLPERGDFEKQLAVLFGAWGRTVWEATTEAYWKGMAKMSLPDFTRTVERAVQEFADDADMKLPTVGALWSIRRSLRTVVAPAQRELGPESWHGDRWDELANMHLWNSIRRRILVAKRYAADAILRADTTVVPGAETDARTRVLLAWRDAWALDMREAAAEGALPEDHGKAWWAECMAKAEAEIDRRIARA